MDLITRDVILAKMIGIDENISINAKNMASHISS